MVIIVSVKRTNSRIGRPVRAPGEKGTKEKIFEAAVDLFAEKGFEGVSVREIARAVGISESTVYKHYSSKDAILEAIFAYVETKLYATPWVNDDCVDGVLDSIAAHGMPERMFQFLVADPYLNKIIRIMLIELNHNDKIRDYVRRELFERPVDENEVMFRKLAERGKIRDYDPRALATVYYAFIIYRYLMTFILSREGQADSVSAESAGLQIQRLFAEILLTASDGKHARK
jgi:Transcriptional regulator